MGNLGLGPTSKLPSDIHETELNVFHFNGEKILLGKAIWSWMNNVLKWRSKHERKDNAEGEKEKEEMEEEKKNKK